METLRFCLKEAHPFTLCEGAMKQNKQSFAARVGFSTGLYCGPKKSPSLKY